MRIRKLYQRNLTEGARRKWDEKVYIAATTSKEASNQPLFSYHTLTIEFSGLIEKMLGLVADKVYLLVIKTTINTALQCYRFIHCLECNHGI